MANITLSSQIISKLDRSKFIKLVESKETDKHWYNTERLHSALGYLTPFEMEIKKLMAALLFLYHFLLLFQLLSD